MTVRLDLDDIQGNVVRAYSAYNYPYARYLCLNIAEADAGRAFVETVRLEVTDAQRWARGSKNLFGEQAIPRPPASVNMAFTFRGLVRLGLPTRTLRAMPDAFIDGMARRAHLLGDTGVSAPSAWDPVWRRGSTGDLTADAPGSEDDVHILILINGEADADGHPVDALEDRTQWIREACDRLQGGVRLLSGHGAGGADFQPAGALLAHGPNGWRITGKEHFGFTDGIGNPVFEGQYAPEVEARRVIGRGKLTPDGRWAPLAAGEFILGLPDESQELPPAAPPWSFSRNGSFLVFRKLHQNVRRFRTFIDETAETYAHAMGLQPDVARETLMAKIVGRWPDGTPLMAAPDYAALQAFRAKHADAANDAAARAALMRELSDFAFRDDPEGVKCPLGAHLRRANTRDMLDPSVLNPDAPRSGSALNKRRRILRRGLPYGAFDDDAKDDSNEHGIIFMALCADIFRQFEFVQQQWMEYGMDFEAGNEACPLVGIHEDRRARHVIPSDPRSGKPPFFCSDLPQFVETRGGDYFFLPSLTALRALAEGAVDPT